MVLLVVLKLSNIYIFHRYGEIDDKDYIYEYILHGATESGHLDFIESFCFEMNFIPKVNYYIDIASLALDNCHINIVFYAYNKIGDRIFEGGNFYSYALKTRNTQFLDWLIKQNCPKDDFIYYTNKFDIDIYTKYALPYKMQFDDDFIFYAIRDKNYEVAKWFLSNFDTFNGIELARFFEKSEDFDYDFMVWIMKTFNFDSCINMLFQRIILSGNMKLIKWFDQNYDCKNDTTLMNFAVQNDDLLIVKWLHDHGYEYDKNLFLTCCRYGNLHIIKYCFRINKFRIDILKLSENIFNPYVLKWVEENIYLKTSTNNLKQLKMSLQTKEAYKCFICMKAATEGYSCCSIECRFKVPNCNVQDCTKATLPCIHQGIHYWSEKCHEHGGRVRWDGDIVDNKIARPKELYVLTQAGWYPAVLQ